MNKQEIFTKLLTIDWSNESNKQEIFTKLLTSDWSNESNTEEIINIIEKLLSHKDHIFRGENEHHRNVSSKLYREYHDIIHSNFSVFNIQQALIERGRRHIRADASDIEVLTELQHYGGKTTLIDFTTNALIALFFACYGGFSKDGRIIVLKNPEALPKDPIKDNDKSPYRIQPSANPRANFQSSVFVQIATAYLEEGSYEVISIKQEHKKDYLGSLKQFFGIHADTVYNDIHGVIQTQDDYTTVDMEVYKGNSYFQNKEYNQAIEHYGNAIKFDPDYANAFFNRGMAYERKGKYKLAIADFTNAIKLNPYFAEAFYNRGIAYERNGENDKTIADYSKAIALNPDFAEAFNNRGIAYGSKGEYDLAIADFNKAIALNPDFAEAFYFRGGAYESKGEYDQAIADFNKAIALKPDFAEAFYNRGIAYESNDEYDLAIADYTHAIVLKPNYAEAFCFRGIAYENKGEHDLAIADFTKAIALNPDDVWAFCGRGLAYESKSEYDLAITDYTQAIALNPDFAEAFVNRSMAYKSKGEYDLAIADVKQAIKLLTQQGKIDLANKIKRILQQLKDQKLKTKTPNHDQQKPNKSP